MRNTDIEATKIFTDIPVVVAKNKGFIIAYFHNGTRTIGIYKDAHMETSVSKSLATLDLADAQGNIKTYDIYGIKKLD